MSIRSRDRVCGVERPPCQVCGNPLASSAGLQEILAILGAPVCPKCEKIRARGGHR